MASLDVVFSSPLFGNSVVSRHIENTLIDLKSLESSQMQKEINRTVRLMDCH